VSKTSVAFNAQYYIYAHCSTAVVADAIVSSHRMTPHPIAMNSLHGLQCLRNAVSQSTARRARDAGIAWRVMTRGWHAYGVASVIPEGPQPSGVDAGT
jgi:hypothetical protein